MQGIEFQIVNDSEGAVNGIERLEKALSGLKTATGTGASAISRVASGIKRLRENLEGIDTKGMSAKLKGISAALAKLNVPDTAKISATLPKNIAALNTSVSGVDTVKLNALASGLNAIGTVSDKAKVSITLSKNITALNSALSALDPSAADKLKNLASGLQPLSALGNQQIRPFLTQLKKLPDIINDLQAADIDKFTQQMKDLATAMKPFADEMQKVSNGFSAFPSRIQKLITSTKAYNKEIGTSTRMAGKVLDVLKNAGSTIKQFATNISNVLKTVGSAIAKFGNFFSVLTKIGSVVTFSSIKSGLEECVVSASEATEVANTFSTSLGEYAQSAWEYAQRVQEVLGIDPVEFVGEQGVINSIITGFGVAGDKAEIMSRNLTQLGYDLQSLYGEKLGTSMEEMFQKVRSGISGELEPLRNLGFDLSTARLQQEALNLGITKSVSAMTQAEKAQLRYHAMLTQLIQAQGDFARNLETPANLMRLLRSQINQLTREIGNLFLPILKAVLPVLIAVARAIRSVVAAIGALFGIDISTKLPETFEGVSGTAGEIEDSVSGTAGGLKDAADKAKDLKNALLGIDELNIISPPDNTASSVSNSGSGAGAGTGSGGFDLDPIDYSELFLNSGVLESVEAFQAKLQPFVDWFEQSMERIQKAAEGTDLDGADTITEKLIRIFNNPELEAAISDMATELATMLNHLGDNIDWEAVGRAIGTGFDLAFSFAVNFIRTYDTKNLGSEVAKLINGAISEIDWNVVGETLASHVTMPIDFLSGLVENIDAAELGTSAGEFIRAILNSITEALNDVDWNKVGEQIGTFVANLDINSIISTVFETIGTAIGAFFTTVGTADGESPWVGIIVAALGIKQIPFGKIATTVKSALEMGQLISALDGATGSIKTATQSFEAAHPTLSKLKGAFDTGTRIIAEVAGSAIIIVGTIAILGWELQKVAEAWQSLEENTNQVALAVTMGTLLLGAVGAVCAMLGKTGATVAKDVGIGALILLEMGAATAIFLAEIWAIGWGLDQVGQAWQPVLDNGENIATAIGVGTGILVGIGIVTAALGAASIATVGLLPLAMAAGAGLLIEMGVETLIFLDEIRAIGESLGQVGQAWQPVLDNGENIATAIEKGTELLIAIGGVTAALGVATILTGLALPAAIKAGSDMLISISEAVVDFAESLSKVADTMSGRLAPALERLNEKLPSLTDNLTDFVDFMTDFAEEVVRYTEVSGIAALSSTIDTIIGWFTEDPIDKLAKDVQKISDQSAALNEKLGIAVPELKKAVSMLQDYQNLLKSIESITGNKVEIASGMFVNMKEVGQNLVTGFVDGIRSKSADFSNAGKEIVNGFKDSVTSASDSSKSSITAWAANLKNWFTGNGFGAINRSTFQTYGKDIVAGFGTGVQNSYATSKSSLISWGANIQSWFGQKVSYSSFYDIAKDVIDGFNAGINAYYKTTEKYMKKWADAAAAAYKAALDSNSPSKRFMRIGEDTVRGYNLGIEKLSDTTRDAVNKWADSFADFAPIASVTIDPSALLHYGNDRISRGISADVSAHTSFADNRDATVSVDDIAAAVLRALQESGLIEDVRRQADKPEKTVVQIGNRVLSEAVSAQQKANGYAFVK